jgi:hypothetical protein
MYIIAHFSEKEKKKQCRFQIGIYLILRGDTVGRGLAPAGQFVKQIDIAAGDKMLFSFGKSENCSNFRWREQAPALRKTERQTEI